MTEPSLLNRLCTLCGVQARQRGSRPGPTLPFPPTADGSAGPPSAAPQTFPFSGQAAALLPWKAAAVLAALGAGAATIGLTWNNGESATPAATAGATLPAGNDTGRTLAAPQRLPHGGADVMAMVPQGAAALSNARRQGVQTAGGILDGSHPAAAEGMVEMLESPFAPTTQRVADAGPAVAAGQVTTAEAIGVPDGPALAAPPAAAPTGEKLLSFNFRSAPWDLVLTRFSETIGLPLEMKTVPPGTLTYFDPRPYTATETLHVLNHLMRPTGCAVIRDGDKLVVLDLHSMPQPAAAPTTQATAEAVAQMQQKMARLGQSPNQPATAGMPTAPAAAPREVAYGLFDERPAPAPAATNVAAAAPARPLPPAPAPDQSLQYAPAAPAMPVVPAVPAQTALAYTRSTEADEPEMPPPAPPVAEEGLSFHFDKTPWEAVLRGYAQATGVTLQMAAVPPGALTHTDPRQISPAEAFDILNSFLFEQGFFLVRSPKTLTVVKLAEGIPRGLIHEVAGTDFSHFAQSDLVSVTLPLGDAQAEATAQQVETRLGPLGGVERLTGPTRLRIIDTASNVARILQTLTARPQ